MTDTPAFELEPRYFAAPRGAIFGIVARPDEPQGTVVLAGGGWHGGMNSSNRMVKRMADRLAASGRTTARFDWHGAGESPGHINRFHLGDPFDDDIVAIADELHADGGLPTTLVGVCFGARSAMTAARQVESLEAVVLVSYPFQAGRAKAVRAERIKPSEALRQGLRPSVIKGWADPATRRVYLKFLGLRWRALLRKLGLHSPPAVAEYDERRAREQAADVEILARDLGDLAARDVRILFLFGEEDAHFGEFDRTSSGPLADVLNRYASHIEVAVSPGDLQGFSNLESQNTVVDTVTGWLAPQPSAHA